MNAHICSPFHTVSYEEENFERLFLFYNNIVLLNETKCLTGMTDKMISKNKVVEIRLDKFL